MPWLMRSALIFFVNQPILEKHRFLIAIAACKMGQKSLEVFCIHLGLKGLIELQSFWLEGMLLYDLVC